MKKSLFKATAAGLLLSTLMNVLPVNADTLTKFPISEEPLEMSLIAPGTGLAEWKDMPTLQEYEKMTNIKWEYITPPMADFSTRLNLAFASGDLPDVIFAAGSQNLTRGMEVDYGSQGILLPLEDLLAENAPNLSKVLEENPDIKKSITAPDGHIYSLPYINHSSISIWPLGPMWYNGTWLEALGVEEVPKTVDEFYDLLVRMRDEDPNGNGQKDEIPLTDVKLDTIRLYMMASFGMKSSSIEEVDGKVRFAPSTENYRGYLEFMKKLYSEKLLDQETFIQSNEQKKAKGQNNQIGVFQDYFSYFTLGENEKEAMNDPMFQTLTSEFSPETLAVASPRFSTGTFAVTNQAKDPAAAVRWVDYFYSEDGYEFINQGPEGFLWNKGQNAAGDEIKLFNEENVDVAKAEDYRGTITPAYGILVPVYETDLTAIKVNPEDPDVTEFTEFLRAETEEKVTPYAEVPFPITYLTKDEQDQISMNATDISTYVTEMEAKFITGTVELNDDTWADYLKTLENMGIEDYVKVYQGAYDRWANS
ncbi:extracellular solute-binding protein [Globicatella sanguinis]